MREEIDALTKEVEANKNYLISLGRAKLYLLSLSVQLLTETTPDANCYTEIMKRIREIRQLEIEILDKIEEDENWLAANPAPVIETQKAQTAHPEEQPRCKMPNFNR